MKKAIISLFLLQFPLFLTFMHAAINHEEYRYMDNLALKANADKGSFFHNYTEIYADYFAPLRDKKIRFLEIGIDNGNSVKLWENYFKNASLYFIDITLQNVKYASERSKYFVVDQENPRDLNKFIQETGGLFDVIIDDGGHTMNQQIVSFQCLFPHVKPGGLYIIEDLHTSYWKEFGGGDSQYTAIAFLKALIDEINFVGYRTSHASHLHIDPVISGEMNIYREQIRSIHFYDSLAVIIKR
jgi:hypothetical protein